MNRNAVIAIVVGVTAAVGGCQRLNYGQRVEPLPAIPAQPVAPGGALQPLVLTPDPAQPAASEPWTNPDGSVQETPAPGAAPGAPAGEAAPPSAPGSAAIAPPQGGTQIGRTDLLGGWTVSAAGESCKLFMNLTTWSGGYRASTRGCSAGALGRIAAWDLNGSQVVLKDAAGADLAHLFMSAPERFNGQTSAGQPIAFFR